MSRLLLVPFVAIPFVIGCTEPDEPSPLTPLTFAGVVPGDALAGGENELLPTAVGGTQDVAMFDEATGTPWTGQVGAFSDTDSVHVSVIDRNVLTLTGDGPGDGQLRIVATDGSLMDTVDVAAAPVATAALSWPYDGDVLATRGPFKLWNGTRQELVIALYDADGRRLVDDSATIHPNGPGLGLQQTTWDSFTLAQVPPGTTATSFTIIAGGQSFAVNVATVDAIDAVEVVAPANDVHVIGVLVNVCFVARSGDAHVLGAPWQFATNGAVELDEPEDDGFMDNCALVRTSAVGTATVSASVGALTASTTFEVFER